MRQGFWTASGASDWIGVIASFLVTTFAALRGGACSTSVSMVGIMSSCVKRVVTRSKSTGSTRVSSFALVRSIAPFASR